MNARTKCWAALILISLALPAFANAQGLRIKVRAEVGVLDDTYRSCNGLGLSSFGASVEVGEPFFVETLGEGIATFHPECLIPISQNGTNTGSSVAALN